MKKIILIIIVIVLAVIFSTGCGRDNIDQKETPLSFSEIIESENLSDVTLTIYSMKSFTLRQESADELINHPDTIKIVVSGRELKEHTDLLNQLINTELIPVENESRVDARLYYVFEHKEYGELFSFLAGGAVGTIVFLDGIEAVNTLSFTVFVNGIEVESNDIFYDVVRPFLAE